MSTASAAPLPKPEPEPASASAPEPGPDADGWALLEGLRRRLDDQAGQGRRTQQQVTQLAESIGALVELQRRRTRGINLNSFVAYLIFTVLCSAGFYLLYSTRAHELVTTRDRVRGERDAAVRRADDVTTRLAARELADARAWEIYELLEAGKHADATAKLAAIGDLPLSRTERAVLAARAHETQVMEVDAALKTAAAAAKQGRLADAIAPLEAALVGEPAGPRAATLHYYLGVAYAKTDLAKAVTHLSAAVAADVDQEDARFQLASALDRSGQYAKARGEYDRFATAHPQSQLAVFAMRRSGTLARMPAVAPAAVTPAPTAPRVPATSPQPGAAAPKPTAVTPPASAPGATPPGGAAIKPTSAPATAPTPTPSPSPAAAMPGKPAAPVRPLLAPAKPAPAAAGSGAGSGSASASDLEAMSTPAIEPTALDAPPSPLEPPSGRDPAPAPAPAPAPGPAPSPSPSPLDPPHEREPAPQPPVAQRPLPVPAPIDAQPSLIVP